MTTVGVAAVAGWLDAGEVSSAGAEMGEAADWLSPDGAAEAGTEQATTASKTINEIVRKEIFLNIDTSIFF